MIKAKHHWFFVRFFDWYVPYLLKKDFSEVQVEGEWVKNDKGSLIIGNHISWWDGFWALYLNKKLLNKHFHAMMLEEQLAPRKFLNKTGAFSINPGSRSVIESIKYCALLLSDPNNCVTLYPQGKIASITSPVFNFEKGVEKILEKSEPIQILFYVAFIDYFSDRKPGLYLYISEIEYFKYSSAELGEKYQQFYNESNNKQAQKTR